MTMLQHGMVGSETAAYIIGKSLRLRALAGGNLTRTFVAGDRRTWTLKMSVRRGRVSTAEGPLFCAIGNRFVFRFSDSGSSTDTIQIYDYNGSSFDFNLITTPVFRDVTGTYEIQLVLDTNNATSTDRVRLYVNGTRITTFSTSVYPSLSYQGSVNTANQHAIGRLIGFSSYFDGYISDVHFVDGQALDPSSFGETRNGEWVPKQYTGTYGTTGFHLDFSDGTSLTTLGYDAVGTNHWTLNSISITTGTTYDWMDDTPSNVFAILNNLDGVTSTNKKIQEGGLRNESGSAAFSAGFSSIALPSTGKWYFEGIQTNFSATSNEIRIGISSAGATPPMVIEYIRGPSSNGILVSGSVVSGFSGSNGDVLGFAVDCDTGVVLVYWNGTLQYTSSSLSVAGQKIQVFCSGVNVAHANFGQRPFSYTPPTGYQTLCTANLTNVSITTSGSFTGNASANGPVIDINGVPTAMTINSNAVTFATHADKLANGFKLRTSSASYNAAGTNTYSITTTGPAFKYARAQVNP